VKAGVRLAHIEAGLRSGDLAMPEERNRIEVDRLSTVLFAPDERSRETLVAEGVAGRVEVVGDVMADALLAAAARARAVSDVTTRLGLEEGGYALATVHRAENTDDPDRLRAILEAFDALAQPIVFPVHPRTRAVLARIGYEAPEHVRLIEPQGYLDLVRLLASARVALTDSGGLQKEAYWLGVPCVTLRDETEWVETVASGWNVLAGADRERFVDAARAATRPALRPALYGDGNAGARVVSLLERSLPAVAEPASDAAVAASVA
jgi:UDP-N-acetylglucosamine 2-epimerase